MTAPHNGDDAHVIYYVRMTSLYPGLWWVGGWLLSIASSVKVAPTRRPWCFKLRKFLPRCYLFYTVSSSGRAENSKCVACCRPVCEAALGKAVLIRATSSRLRLADLGSVSCREDEDCAVK